MARTVKAYEAKMLFSATIGLKTANDFLAHCGLNERLCIRDAIEISITQTLLKIPDEEYLAEVARILVDHYETKDVNLTECHFAGYKYIKEAEVEVDDA